MKYPTYFEPKKSLNLFGLSDEFNLLKKLYIKKKLPKVFMLSGRKGSGKSTLINHLMYYIFDNANYETGTDRIAGVASKIEADIIINVQGDEPFINPNTIQSILNIFTNDKENSIGVISVMTTIKDKKELKNPNNVKVFTDVNNNAIYFSRYSIPFKSNLNISKAHKHVGVYAFRKKSLIEFAKLKVGELESSEKIEALRLIENDIKIKMINSNETFIGVDTEEDIQKAIKIFCEKGNL